MNAVFICEQLRRFGKSCNKEQTKCQLRIHPLTIRPEQYIFVELWTSRCELNSKGYEPRRRSASVNAIATDRLSHVPDFLVLLRTIPS